MVFLKEPSSPTVQASARKAQKYAKIKETVRRHVQTDVLNHVLTS